MLCTAGVGLPPGGEWSSSVGEEIEQEREDVCHYLEDMEVLADVMEAQGHWSRPQVMDTSCPPPLTESSPVLHPEGDVRRPQEDVLQPPAQQVSLPS